MFITGHIKTPKQYPPTPPTPPSECYKHFMATQFNIKLRTTVLLRSYFVPLSVSTQDEYNGLDTDCCSHIYILQTFMVNVLKTVFKTSSAFITELVLTFVDSTSDKNLCIELSRQLNC